MIVTKDLFRDVVLVLDRLAEFCLIDSLVRRVASINLEKDVKGLQRRGIPLSFQEGKYQQAFFLLPDSKSQMLCHGAYSHRMQVFPWVLMYVAEFGKGEFDLGTKQLCIEQR